jgi:hypothetical protein
MTKGGPPAIEDAYTKIAKMLERVTGLKLHQTMLARYIATQGINESELVNEDMELTPLGETTVKHFKLDV